MTTPDQPRRFFIPAYQRGYRWNTQQVTQLLEDVREFARHARAHPDDFYCLQPLVLKPLTDGALEVVDGQQRLTTIYLILRYFNSLRAANKQQVLFDLEYETRKGLREFLAAPTEEAASTNADYHHFYTAMAAIEDWFTRYDHEVDELRSTLLTRTKVIWYQLGARENSVEAFTRLNMGKIPLTNDELIRALFLRRPKLGAENITDVQQRIAQEWDLMEKALQSNPFWYFLSNDKHPVANRIGLIFRLVAEGDIGGPLPGDDAYTLFYHFYVKFQTPGANVEEQWLLVKRCFLALEEWYEDRHLFHMVGYLVHEGTSISQLLKLAKDATKSKFEQALRAEIFRRLMRNDLDMAIAANTIADVVGKRIEQLAYGNADVRSILLLFNLASLLSNRRSNMRFQFNSFKEERWDIEHIRSVSDDRPDRPDTRREWLRHVRAYLQGDAEAQPLIQRIDAYSAMSPSEATYVVFDDLYDTLLSHFDEAHDGQVENGIGNLTLLDLTTNRSYGNAVFPVKRRSVLGLDHAGVFVPLCTRNVFLKCYSNEVAHALVWRASDQADYEAAIAAELTRFFCNTQESAR